MSNNGRLNNLSADLLLFYESQKGTKNFDEAVRLLGTRNPFTLFAALECAAIRTIPDETFGCYERQTGKYGYQKKREDPVFPTKVDSILIFHLTAADEKLYYDFG